MPKHFPDQLPSTRLPHNPADPLILPAAALLIVQARALLDLPPLPN